MLHFPCPKCGGKVETAEEDSVRRANSQAKRFAHGSMGGPPHPLIGMAATAIAVGNFIYQRVPGGGRKRCTNPCCQHEFS